MSCKTVCGGSLLRVSVSLTARYRARWSEQIKPVSILRREHERRAFDDPREPELAVTARHGLGAQGPVTRLQHADPGHWLPLAIDDLAGDGPETVRTMFGTGCSDRRSASCALGPHGESSRRSGIDKVFVARRQGTRGAETPVAAGAEHDRAVLASHRFFQERTVLPGGSAARSGPTHRRSAGPTDPRRGPQSRVTVPRRIVRESGLVAMLPARRVGVRPELASPRRASILSSPERIDAGENKPALGVGSGQDRLAVDASTSASATGLPASSSTMPGRSTPRESSSGGSKSSARSRAGMRLGHLRCAHPASRTAGESGSASQTAG